MPLNIFFKLFVTKIVNATFNNVLQFYNAIYYFNISLKDIGLSRGLHHEWWADLITLNTANVN